MSLETNPKIPPKLFRRTRNAIGTIRDYFDPESDWKPLDPPLTSDDVTMRRELMATQTNLRFVKHNGRTDIITVPSAGEHYDGNTFKWDRLAAVGDNALNGDPDTAMAELRTGERFRDKATGFMTNKARIDESDGSRVVWPESKVQVIAGRNPYSQPSLEGWAVLRTYEALLIAAEQASTTDAEEEKKMEAYTFLKEMYGTVKDEQGNPSFTGLRGECEYWIQQRQNDAHNPLTYITHVNETGRDYDRANGGPRNIDLPGTGRVVTSLNSATRWAQMQIFNARLAKVGRHEENQQELPPEQRRSDWNPEKVRRKYGTNDVMMNVFHVMNLRNTVQVARTLADFEPEQAERYQQEAAYYEGIADGVEEAILTRMWHEKRDNRDKQETFFYNIDKNGEQIPVDSITGLFPLLLQNISAEQVTTLLNRLEDPAWFGTPYPIPSHPVRSKFYDPHYTRREGPDWMGPVWGITNYFLREEGLTRQAERFLQPDSPDYNPELGKRCWEIANRITQTDQTLLAINSKTREQYDPETGQGQRVEDFMWSNLMRNSQNLERVREKYTIAP